MKFSTRIVKDVAILDIEGKILLGEGDDELGEEIQRLVTEGRKKIILNLACVPYIDSAGLQAIVRGFTRCRKSGGNIVWLAPNQRLVDLLTVTKLAKVFQCCDSEKEAITLATASTNQGGEA